VGFEHEAHARRFWEAMRERLKEFSLSLHPDKTRLDRVWPLCGSQTSPARARQAGNLQVPGLCFHLWADAQGQAPA